MQRPGFVVAAALALVACGKESPTTAPYGRIDAEGSVATEAVGQVYIASNATSGNDVLVFNRMSDGSLSAAGAYPTGGTGSGGGLGNQGGVVLSSNGRYLLAVNAGSHDVSVFRIRTDGSLILTDREPSGGTTPISVSNVGLLTYVLNGGGTGNITGFRLNGGNLTMLAGSSRPLSSPTAGAAQVQIAPDSRMVVVTEKATNVIDTYHVMPNGTTHGPVVSASNGATPFGFGFTSGGLLIVSEAFGGAPDASASSSYEVLDNGTLRTVSASVGTTESAACWIAITPNNRFAYTTNTASGTISGYAISSGGLSLLDADGVTGSTGGPGSGPIDLAISMDGRYMYSLNGAASTVSAFAVSPSGSLVAIPVSGTALPPSANGLAVR